MGDVWSVLLPPASPEEAIVAALVDGLLVQRVVELALLLPRPLFRVLGIFNNLQCRDMSLCT